jgi:hypothetical protein
MNNPELRLFIEPWILRFTGRKLLEQFFARFAHLLSSQHSLPTTPEEMAYYNCLADLFERRLYELPEPLMQALYEVEALAAAENWPMPDPPDESAPAYHEPYRLFKAIHRWLEENRGKIPGTKTPEAQGAGMPVSTEAPAAPPKVEKTGTEPEGAGTEAPAAVAGAPPASTAPDGEANSGALGQSALPEAPAAATADREGNSGALGQSALPACPRGPADEPPIQEANSVEAVPPAETDEEAFRRLARLSPADYDRVRHKEARRLLLRIRSLDAEVTARRSDLAADDEANEVDLPVVEPWPEAVTDFADVLHQALDRYERHLWLPPGAAVAITLWTPHADMYTAFHHTPRLILLSDEPGCGKTTTFEVIASMVQKPLRSENMTPAVLFRIVDQHQPTLLLDELDTYLHLEDEMRGLVNAGHKRGSHAYRCEGPRRAVRAFKAHAPVALAALGDLPATLRDRSIIINMTKAQAGQIKARFDPNCVEIESVLASKILRWTTDNFEAVKACNPTMPSGAYNRTGDNWRPLFAIAQVAGGDWPALAADAFARLTARPPSEERGRVLLADIRRVFADAAATRMFSTDLLHALCSLPDRPYCYPENPKTRGIILTPASLSRWLQPYGIRPRAIRIGPDRTKGYELSQLEAAFKQHLNGQGHPDSNGASSP